ncbi:MAG TPA: 1-deoxy-D-xylulose-5-phosphate reductoisomerase, partial [Rhodospirillales bacterium]|nr:1-deoxy-D-xylulose-5-phosphate reductoisomerase [Rhodospirillales bacterium]
MEMKISPDLTNDTRAKRRVTILGATGSVGCNTLDLIRNQPDQFAIEALTGNKNVDLLISQAKEFTPKLAVIGDDALYGELKDGLSGTDIAAASGQAAMLEAADVPSEIVIAGIVGVAGLAPTLKAAQRGVIIALANKECLVCAGDFFLDEIEHSGATLLPIDSEHNAIFQVFDIAQAENVDHLTLTASGGPFRNASLTEMLAVTPEQAVVHPNW